MPSVRGTYRNLDHREHQDLLRQAISIEQGQDPLESHPVQHSTHTVKKVVEVPYHETVRVPVKKKVPTMGVEKKVMRGVELVPVRKYREIEETVIEVKEEEVKGVREVWVKKQVPYTEIVKKPVKVTRVRKVPYTDYEQKEVEVTVDVPCHRVETHTGYRDDKVLKTKLVEVEQDVTVEHRPALHSQGPPRVRELGEEANFGLVSRGKSVVATRPRSARPQSAPSRRYSVMQSARRPQPATAHEFSLRLRKRPEKQLLGVHVDTSDGASVVVRRIGAGLIRDWNIANPDREVMPGDRIVAANGCSGDADEIMRLCNASMNLELHVQPSR